MRKLIAYNECEGGITVMCLGWRELVKINANDKILIMAILKFGIPIYMYFKYNYGIKEVKDLKLKKVNLPMVIKDVTIST